MFPNVLSPNGSDGGKLCPYESIRVPYEAIMFFVRVDSVMLLMLLML